MRELGGGQVAGELVLRPKQLCKHQKRALRAMAPDVGGVCTEGLVRWSVWGRSGEASAPTIPPSLNYNQTAPCKQATSPPLVMGHWGVQRRERKENNKCITSTLL